jgi:hypothetical protein
MSSTVISAYLDAANGVTPVAPVPAKQAKPKREPKPAPVVTEQTRERRASYKSALKCGKWVVEFTKVDGTPATMECTLDEKFLPPTDPMQIPVVRPNVNEHLLHVYATDRQAWRSFTVDNVTKFYKLVESL